MSAEVVAANVVVGIALIALAILTFRLAQGAASLTNVLALRQGPQPASAAEIRNVEVKRYSWIWLLLAMIALGLLVSYIRPWRYLPVQNPSISARSPLGFAVLELQLHSRRLEEGDSFLAVLHFRANPSVPQNCVLATQLIATLDAPSADLSLPRKWPNIDSACESSFVWVVAPKHAGRLLALANIMRRKRNGSYLEMASLPISVQVEQVNNVNIILSGLVPLIVGAIGFLTPRKRTQKRFARSRTHTLEPKT